MSPCEERGRRLPAGPQFSILFNRLILLPSAAEILVFPALAGWWTCFFFSFLFFWGFLWFGGPPLTLEKQRESVLVKATQDQIPATSPPNPRVNP